MRASALAALAAALIVLPGCLQTPAALETSALDVAPPALRAEGAVLAELRGAVHVAWEGEVVPFQAVGLGPSPNVLLSGGDGFVDHPLVLPPEVTIVQAWLNWTDDDGQLQFRLRNESGFSWCGSAPAEGTERACFATFWAPREKALEWTMRVIAPPVRAPGRAVPVAYTMEAIFSAAPLPILGSPAPFGPGAPMVFAPPVVVSEDKHSAEPSIAVTPAGVVYVAAPTGPQESLWRSTDGLTFELVQIHGTPTDPGSFFPIGGGDSDVAVVGEDTVYFTDQQQGQRETVSSSHDGGETWFTNPLASGVTTFADRQWLVTDGEMTVWLAFNNGPNPPTSGRPAVVKSLDGGKTWPIKTFVPGDRCLRGNLARAPDGTLYLGGCDAEGPGVAISTDGGLSFTWTNVAKREGETTTAFCVPCHLFTVVTTDAAGNAYAVWSDESQAPDDPQGPGDGSMGLNVWMVSSTDRGASWSAPKRVNNAPGTYVLPWATGGADGKLAIAYYGTRFVGHPERAMGEWYPIVAFTEDALADAPVFIESSASPTLAQYGPVCMRGSGCGNARNLLDFFQIQADSEGRIHMAFTDGTPGGTARASIIAYGRQVGGLTLGGPSVDKNGGPGAARAILPVPTV